MSVAAAIPPPLVVDGRGPLVLPVHPLRGRERDQRPLFVHVRTVYLRTRFGWIRIPRGYVTDFGSIPTFASVITLTRLQPLGSHAMAADGHDWPYAIGEPGWREKADTIFRDQMRLDGTNPVRREVMFYAVRAGGGGGYARAAEWWGDGERPSVNFADPETGEYPVRPPFRRYEAFAGQRWGLRDRPDWIEPT